MRTRQFARPSILLIAALTLVGCDRITGAGQQKTLDAEAIGYACRISLKTPEDCMKENEVQSPTSILLGWKEADKDIKEKAIDPNMGKHQTVPETQQSAPVAAETEGKTAAVLPVKNAAAKSEKPATATGKPDQGTAEKKTNR
ncbi:MAG TPA: hypothetical protein VFQ94_03545 [Gallionella sp.]|nr:hypothetical protein [Gallionella sp.]